MSKHFKRTRYSVQAKRKGTDEKWTEWTAVNDYYQAVKHSVHVANLGFDSNLVIKDGAVKKLWELLGAEGDVKKRTDAILDAGFRKESEVAKEIFEEFEALFGKATEVTVLATILETPEYKRFKKKYTGGQE